MEQGTGVVRATRFELLDEQGRVRAVLGLLGRGTADVFGLTLLNEYGGQRAWIVADGPTAQMGIDHGGNQAAVMSANGEGFASVAVFDATGAEVRSLDNA